MIIFVKPMTLKAYNHIKAQIYTLTPNEGGRDTPIAFLDRLTLYSLTWNADSKVKIDVELEPSKQMILPGEDAKVEIAFRRTLPLEIGQRFTLRDGHFTVGTGIVTHTLQNIEQIEFKKLWNEHKKRLEQAAA